jgi:hypothetical protein
MADLNYKRFLLKTVSVTVAQSATSGVSSADRELINGTIVGYYPVTNQDQFVDEIALAATTGIVTVTLAAAATAANYYKVVVMVKK